MALTAKARIPCVPLDAKEKELAQPKELLVDYETGTIMVCKSDGTFVDITNTIKEVIENDPEAIISSITFEIEGNIYNLETVVNNVTSDISDIQDALGYTKDASGNVSFALLQNAVTIDPTTGNTNKKIKAEDITETSTKKFASDTEKAKWNAATKPETLYTTILAETDAGNVWTGSAAPYTQKINVSGILESDNPIVDIKLGDVYDTIQKQLDSYAYIYKILTYDGYIVVYASKKTEYDIDIQMRVDR